MSRAERTSTGARRCDSCAWHGKNGSCKCLDTSIVDGHDFHGFPQIALTARRSAGRLSMSVVRIEQVYKDYLLGDQKAQALKDVTLSFDSGVFLAITAPSGSGKPTLLNLIGCIDTPTSGNIFINDQNR